MPTGALSIQSRAASYSAATSQRERTGAETIIRWLSSRWALSADGCEDVVFVDLMGRHPHQSPMIVPHTTPHAIVASFASFSRYVQSPLATNTGFECYLTSVDATL